MSRSRTGESMLMVWIILLVVIGGVALIAYVMQDAAQGMFDFATPYFSGANATFTATGLRSAYALEIVWDRWPLIVIGFVAIIVIARSLRRDSDAESFF